MIHITAVSCDLIIHLKLNMPIETTQTSLAMYSSSVNWTSAPPDFSYPCWVSGKSRLQLWTSTLGYIIIIWTWCGYIIIIRVYFNGHPGHGFIHQYKYSGLKFFYSAWLGCQSSYVLISSLTIAFIVMHYSRGTILMFRDTFTGTKVWKWFWVTWGLLNKSSLSNPLQNVSNFCRGQNGVKTGSIFQKCPNLNNIDIKLLVLL